MDCPIIHPLVKKEAIPTAIEEELLQDRLSVEVGE